jgi:hypothetical protein
MATGDEDTKAIEYPKRRDATFPAVIGMPWLSSLSSNTRILAILRDGGVVIRALNSGSRKRRTSGRLRRYEMNERNEETREMVGGAMAFAPCFVGGWDGMGVR